MARCARERGQAPGPGRRLLPTSQARRVIAVDGKTLRESPARGSAAADALAASGGGRTHLVAALDHEAGVVIAQAACDLAAGKGGEVAAAAALLHDLDVPGLLTGAVVTVDALHTQRSHAALLHAAGAHYVFTVKGNQPILPARRPLPGPHRASGPHVIAALRNLAISVLRLDGWANIAAGLHRHAREPDLPLATYGIT